MLTPVQLMDDVCNKKRLSLLGTNLFSDLNMGKYMFNRWLSMTSFRNLLAAEAMNCYDSSDDSELSYVIGTVLSGRCGKYRYLKKKSEKPKRTVEREWGDELSNREKEFYADTLDFLENIEHEVHSS